MHTKTGITFFAVIALIISCIAPCSAAADSGSTNAKNETSSSAVDISEGSVKTDDKNSVKSEAKKDKDTVNPEVPTQNNSGQDDSVQNNSEQDTSKQNTSEQPDDIDTSKSQVETWVSDAKGKRYKSSDGTYLMNEQKVIDSILYAFASDGYLLKGWYQDQNKNWYYGTASGPAQEWMKVGNTRYYFDPHTRIMRTGWLQVGGKWYYLAGSGAMKTGWVYDSSYKAWFYLDKTGAMRTGWLQVGGKWYYLAGSGAMKTGWVYDSSYKAWFYLDKTGAMRTGWLQVGGKWYYLAGSGAMKTGWLKSGSVWYYLSNDGSMATGWKTIGGEDHYFKTSGSWVVGRASLQSDWKRIKGLYSPTNYLVGIVRSRPSCTVYRWSSNGWEPFLDFKCSVGAPSTPTPSGTRRVEYRIPSFGSGYTVYKATNIGQDYFIHSILYDQGTYRVQDGTLGGHVSHGCIRMAYNDAKWIYDNLPNGTTVRIF